MTNCSIYQFNAELKGYKPRMWRRFQVSEDISFFAPQNQIQK